MDFVMRLADVEEVEISFDGACRGNGKSNARSSCAVFVMDYESCFSRGKLLAHCTNNAAEIEGAILAMEVIEGIVELCKNNQRKIPKFRVKGDSQHVVVAVKTGRLLAYKKSDRHPNSALWEKLGEMVKGMAGNVHIEWSWVPRHLNVEADEIANCVLDERRPDICKRSMVCKAGERTIEQGLDAILQTMTQKRLRSIRTLPLAVAKQLQTTVVAWAAEFEEGQIFRKLLACLPRILSVYQNKVRNRHDFKQFFHHVTLLGASREYLSDVLASLLVKQTEGGHLEASPPTVDISKVVTTLCSRGLAAKAVGMAGGNVALADPRCLITQGALTHLFEPKKRLPHPLPIPLTPVQVTWPLVLRAFLKLKRGKSPGLTGMTRELLAPLFWSESGKLRDRMTQAMWEIVNVELTPEERTILKTTVLIPITYLDKPGKIRPVQLGEVLGKMALMVAEDGMPNDPSMKRTGWTDDSKGASATAVACVQQSYMRGDPVVCSDGTNAFNLASREEAFAYLKEKEMIYRPLFPLYNLLYSEESETVTFDQDGNKVQTIVVTKGTRQGCVSGPRFLKLSIIKKSMRYCGTLVQIMDDVHIIGAASIQQASDIILDFRKSGLDLAGPKLKIVVRSKGDLPDTVFWPNVREEPVKVFVGPARIHGGLVSSGDEPWPVIRDAVADIFQKVDKRCGFIERLRTTKQAKMLMLRASSRFYSYYAQTIHSRFREDIFNRIDTRHAQAFFSITGVEPDSHHVPRLFSHIEDGGCGLYPYQLLQEEHLKWTWNNCTEALKRLKLPGAGVTEPPNLSILFKWRHLSHEVLGDARTKQVAFPKVSWMTAWPSNSFTRVDDASVEVGFNLIFESLKPGARQCRASGVVLQHLQRDVYTKHILTCASCGRGIFWTRHQRIVYALKSTLAFHDIHSTTVTHDLPLPGRRKGGADLKVFAREVYLIDVTVVYGGVREMNAAYTRKKRKYKKHQELTGIETIPFVMNHCGAVCPRTMKLVFKFAPTKRASAEVIVHCQTACIKGTQQALEVLKGERELEEYYKEHPPKDEDESSEEEEYPEESKSDRVSDDDCS